MRSKLIKMRNDKNLFQESVANAIGISRRMYGYIETGHRNPSWTVARRLEQFFGIPASELLAESEEQQLIVK